MWCVPIQNHLKRDLGLFRVDHHLTGAENDHARVFDAEFQSLIRR